MTTIEEQERAAYAAGDTVRADLLAQIDDLTHTLEVSMRLLSEALSMVEDDEPPSPSGDWADETRKLIEAAP